jgi:1,4-dihydroxy-6-naphthoate synthase
MYVNQLTLDYGERGRTAVQRMLDEAHDKGILPARIVAEYAA